MSARKARPAICLMILLILSIGAFATDPNLVAHWKLDETQDNIAYDSAGENDGTLSSSPVWMPSGGMIDGALDLEGGYINCGNDASLSIDDNITIAFWMYPESFVSGYSAWILYRQTNTSDSNYNFYYFGEHNGARPDDKGKLIVYAKCGTGWDEVSGTYQFKNLDEWHHVIWTYNSIKGGQLYINGVPCGARYGSGKLATNSLNTYIGHSAYDGIMDDIRIYNRAFTNQDAEDLFNETVGLVGHWRLDFSAEDSSQLGNNGAVVGDPGWQSCGKVNGSLYYNGNDHINFGNDPNLSISDNLTLTLWFNPATYTSDYAVRPISRWNSTTTGANYVMYYFGNHNGTKPEQEGLIKFYADRGGSWGAVSDGYFVTELNTWYHIAWNYDTSLGGGQLYINGQPIGNRTGGSGLLATNLYDTKLGYFNFEGAIDDFRLYSTSLTDKQIEHLYEHSVTPSPDILNPGFENITDDRPYYWYDAASGHPVKTLDSTEKHSGSYSWKFQKDTTSLRPPRALSNFIAIDPNQFYEFSLWIKSQSGTELVNVGWEEYDSEYKYLTAYNFVLYNNEISNTWALYSDIYRAAYSQTKYIRLAIHGPLNNGTIWWDDLNLECLGTEYLPKFGCENSATAKSINWGVMTDTIPSYHGGIVWNPSYSMGSRENEDGIDYRILNVNQTVTLTIPDFDNEDANGLPLSPMLLEIAYKDTIDDKTSPGTKADHYDIAYIRSNIEFAYDDPDVSLADRTWYYLTSIGGKADNQWKYMQYIFPVTDFQLLRSVDGDFTFEIRNNGDYDLPIDYVSLRIIDPNQCSEFNETHKTIWGFREEQISDIGETDPENYTDPNLVIFKRDLMKPVYDQTKPEVNEEITSLSGYCFIDETEPVWFSIYSKDGISDLTIEISEDLLNTEDSQYSIPTPEVYHVINDDKRLAPYHSSPYTKRYSKIPDRIDDFETVDIAPDTSQRFWLKIQAPLDTPAGRYEGTITIKKNDDTLKNISVSMVVYDVQLDLSEHANAVYHDPFLKTYSTDLDEVLGLYAETGFDPFYYITSPQVEPNIIDDNIVGYDVSVFEERLNRMYEAGFAKHTLIVELAPSLRDEIYSSIYGLTHDNTPKSDLWNNLSEDVFVDAMEMLLEELNNIAEEKDLAFIYSVTDEPGTDPYRRILADRYFTIITDVNSLTTTTYYTTCEEITSAGDYYTPYDGNIPALTDLVDFKAWTSSHQGEGYLKGYENFGYYTTSTSYLRNPIYNRFRHGLLAFATDAKLVSGYAMGDYVNDPFNDFDAGYTHVYPFTYPDFLYAYPTWTGKLISTMGLEGIREGIKDAKYVGTLKHLIAENPDHPEVADANEFLSTIKARIDTDYWNAYPGQTTQYGYYQEILKDISGTNDPNGFEAFTIIRKKIVDYILAFEYGVQNQMTEQWYQTIQDAINDANDFDEIVVYPGTYYEKINFLGKPITVRSIDPDDWDIVATTVIDANDYSDATGMGVTFESNEGPDSVLSGFTITGADTGVRIYGTSYQTSGFTSPIVEKCIVENSERKGIRARNSFAILRNNILFNNGDHGIKVEGHSVLDVHNNWIYGAKNGIEFTSDSTATVSNNTIVDNDKGIVVDEGAPEIKNCIFWGNTYDDLGSGCTASYSCIEDAFSSSDPNFVGSISVDPNFVDAANDDFHLSPGSLCIDAGDPNGVYTGQTDIDGDNRVIGNHVDMGADEVLE